jgi:hypothetical protein
VTGARTDAANAESATDEQADAISEDRADHNVDMVSMATDPVALRCSMNRRLRLMLYNHAQQRQTEQTAAAAASVSAVQSQPPPQSTPMRSTPRRGLGGTGPIPASTAPFSSLLDAYDDATATIRDVRVFTSRFALLVQDGLRASGKLGSSAVRALLRFAKKRLLLPLRDVARDLSDFRELALQEYVFTFCCCCFSYVVLCCLSFFLSFGPSELT